MANIPVSPKHGLNPSIPVCLFCGKDKSEIILLGRIRKTKQVQTAYGGTSTVVEDNDAEAPMHGLYDYEPCDECARKMALGIALMGITDTPTIPNQPAIAPGAYPTGNYVVVSENFIRNNIPEPNASRTLEVRKAWVPEKSVLQIASLMTANDDQTPETNA